MSFWLQLAFAFISLLLAVASPLPNGPVPLTTTVATSQVTTGGAPLPTSLSPYPWVVLTPPDSRTFDYGHASLIGDVIVVAAGFNIMHYDTKTGNKTIYPVSKMVVDVFGDDASKQMWAVGSPPDDFNGPGLIWHFDGASSNASWKAVSLPFDIKFAFRAIHGTGPNNVWAVAGSGEAPPLATSAIVHWDGQQWTKYLEDKFNTATAVFARGNDVWVGCGDGMILHSSNSFQTYDIVSPSQNGDHSTHQIWGSGDVESPIYVGFSDGLKVIVNPTCTGGAVWNWNGVTSCQVLNYLTIPPDSGNTGYHIETIIGNLPGLPAEVVFTAGTFGWGGIWNGQALVQDTSMPFSWVGQSTYTSLIVAHPTDQGQVYLYGLVSDGSLVRRRLV